ncbi:unnamed protein product [Bursaphelenchus okinawaensis]|uniref:Uncharacterized protein n=1 Tax=Bursaphelenchus okinawaensis TaxID=465554 RepID=A0A811K5W3_9BILA|nr:unnamed protein product [Bursaphelenchus okinawaensis]CAG9093311.1 unnamed protein product [Bursaphelenchus okinawaensis]
MFCYVNLFLVLFVVESQDLIIPTDETTLGELITLTTAPFDEDTTLGELITLTTAPSDEQTTLGELITLTTEATTTQGELITLTTEATEGTTQEEITVEETTEVTTTVETTEATTSAPCCPSGGVWGDWRPSSSSTCSDTCGGYGTQQMERTCLSLQISESCTCEGNSTSTAPCNLQPCPFGRASCATGLSVGTLNGSFACLNATTTNNSTLSCCPSIDLFDEWTVWTSCTSTCGNCSNSTRTRICVQRSQGCSCQSSDEKETASCGNAVCKYPTRSCCSGSSVKPLNGSFVCAS